MNSRDLDVSEYNSYYQPYIDILGETDLIDGLKTGLASLVDFIAALPDDKMDFAYAPKKWSIAEALVHLIDTERIFQYRALRFSRNDKTPLPGFDQDLFVPQSRANSKGKMAITNEFKTVRMATITLFESLNDEELMRFGVASDSKMSVRALGFLMCGHLKHHKKIIEDRYLGHN